MSAWKDVLSKKFWVSVLLMVSVLVGVNGVFALLMSAGLIDYHMTLQGACVAWGIAALVTMRFAARSKSVSLVGGLLISATVLLLVLIISVAVGQQLAENGVWWKCGLSAALGTVLGAVAAPKRKKKHVGREMRKRKEKRR